MKNLWPEDFKAKELKSVKAVLEEQAKLLPKITGDMVYAKIIGMGRLESMQRDHVNDFSYSFNLIAKFLKGYSFKVLDFSYPVTMYPVKITLDELIAEEMQCESVFEVNNENEFIAILGGILNSNRIKDIVGSIIKLSSEQ
ncbi:MAG: hypothetical protein A2097_05985 [Desulfobacula sp. GWF2_41_7]|nr:MAG: hypothetical protein A2097_05985 [Desulfobacula sp. GWF2_41_7]